MTRSKRFASLLAGLFMCLEFTATFGTPLLRKAADDPSAPAAGAIDDESDGMHRLTSSGRHVQRPRIGGSAASSFLQQKELRELRARMLRSTVSSGVMLGPPIVSSPDLEVENLQAGASPFGACGESKLGTASVRTTAHDCTRLGGFATNITTDLNVEEFAYVEFQGHDEVDCHLDWCDGALYGMFAPGRCRDPLASAVLNLSVGDCRDAGFVLLNQSKLADEFADCKVSFCFDLGGWNLRPAESCNQVTYMRQTMNEECWRMGGHVNVKSNGAGWSSDCQMDLCHSQIEVGVEIDTRDAEGAGTNQGGVAYFYTEGEWHQYDLATVAKRNSTLRKKYVFSSWPEKMIIAANGHDEWGMHEIRLMVFGTPVRILTDLPVEGSSNDVPVPDSNYWISRTGSSPSYLEFEFPDVTRFWRSLGLDRKCNAAQSFLSDADDSEAVTAAKYATTYAECQSFCEETSGCYGVDFHKQDRRCALWFQPLGPGDALSGHECFVYWRDSKLESPWLNRPVSAWKMLKMEGHRCLDTSKDSDQPFTHICTGAQSQLWVIDEGRLVNKLEPYRCLERNSTVANTSAVTLTPCELSKNFRNMSNLTEREEATLRLRKPKHVGWEIRFSGMIKLRTRHKGYKNADAKLCLSAILGKQWSIEMAKCNGHKKEQRWMWLKAENEIH
eukprot:TRINITY_DN29128_c0_g1_i1.p1 TRINITY_DN29128_c0_g1~~TRINITY_DN29128_c0_g1_i1.p1  ORF type:complete len:671 (-),score=104.33 TRINITY_DN29128_c0_g1_i1:109-2121(-)